MNIFRLFASNLISILTASATRQRVMPFSQTLAIESLEARLTPTVVPFDQQATNYYLVGLNRAADEAGLATHVRQLAEGVSAPQVARGIIQSVEHNEAFVRSLYRTYLDRETDAAGFKGFTDALSHGVTEDQVTAAILASSEYSGKMSDEQFVLHLYHTILQRDPDPAGQAHFIGVLKQGNNRPSVALALLESEERSRTVATSLYHEILQRNPSSLEVDRWASRLTSPDYDTADAIVDFVSSPEGIARLQTLNDPSAFANLDWWHPETQYTTEPGGVTTDLARWDKLVTGKWYVPEENMTAYTVGLDSRVNTPIGFLNNYTFTCVNGSYSGPTSATIWVMGHYPSTLKPETGTMSGNISPSGKITMTITSPSAPPSYAVGNMLFIAGQWRMTMQTSILNAGGTYDIQWANMTKLYPDQPFPVFDPSQAGSSQGESDPLTSPQWAFLANTEWAIHDSGFFPAGDFGTFRVFKYTDGYFFGTSIGSSEFSVTGSVAPNGSLYLILTSPDGSILTRAGTLARSTSQEWLMLFESYYGTPEFGEARMLEK